MTVPDTLCVLLFLRCNPIHLLNVSSQAGFRLHLFKCIIFIQRGKEHMEFTLYHTKRGLTLTYNLPSAYNFPFLLVFAPVMNTVMQTREKNLAFRLDACYR